MASDHKLQLYFHRSPNSLKVLLFLEECGLPYDIVPVDIYAGEQHRPEFLRINPNAKVPALEDGAVTVFDSNAILLYLAERTGSFGAKSAREHGQLLSWLMFVASGLGPFSGQSVHFLKYSPEQILYAINRYTREAERHYRVLDGRLRESRFLAGETYTIADMAAWGLGGPGIRGPRGRESRRLSGSTELVRTDQRPASGDTRAGGERKRSHQGRTRRGSPPTVVPSERPLAAGVALVSQSSLDQLDAMAARIGRTEDWLAILIDGDTAEGEWHVTAMVTSRNTLAEGRSQGQLLGTAIYRDTFARTSAGWRIKTLH